MSELIENFFTNYMDKECGTGIFGGLAPSSLQAKNAQSWMRELFKIFFTHMDKE
jgi:hypothetical protein